jgi:hypothetical protein
MTASRRRLTRCVGKSRSWCFRGASSAVERIEAVWAHLGSASYSSTARAGRFISNNMSPIISCAGMSPSVANRPSSLPAISCSSFRASSFFPSAWSMPAPSGGLALQHSQASSFFSGEASCAGRRGPADSTLQSANHTAGQLPRARAL